jgi:hypothetical protein
MKVVQNKVLHFVNQTICTGYKESVDFYEAAKITGGQSNCLMVLSFFY